MPGGARLHHTNEIHAEINIQNHYKFKVYSPEVPIVGNVIVAAKRDVTFDNIEISFTGLAVAHNYVQPDPIWATHPFIKLSMPCDSTELADEKVFRAGRTYLIPFHFVVPHKLPVGSCKHSSISSGLQERHLRLPPTIGFCPGDDQSPEAAQISYNINFVAQRRYTAFSHPTVLFSAKQPVRVLSSSPEEPPLDCFQDDRIYRLSATKKFWKSMFMDTGGELKAEASQPKAIVLTSDGSTAADSSIHLRLVFVPSVAEFPPVKLHSVSGKLLCKTFFNVIPISHAPALEPPDRYEIQPYCYKTGDKLFHRPLERLQWETIVLNHDSKKRQNSASSHVSDNLDQTSECRESRGRRASLPWAWKPRGEPSIQYTAELNIPFSLPSRKKRTFLPSFDSCLISRTYNVKVTVRAGPIHGWLTLSVPIQIGVDTIAQNRQELPSAETTLRHQEDGSDEEPPPYAARL